MDGIIQIALKYILRTCSACIPLLLSITFTQAQGSPILGKFSLSESNGQVALDWQIVAGSTCNGIQIYRSIDAMQYSQIGNIAGICGSITEAVNYFFIDTTPVKNTINYYYLELGGVGTSEVLAIEVIDKSHLGYQIRPHPVINTGTIYFDTQAGEEYSLYVYDSSGKVVFHAETSEDHFDIISSAFAPGQYIFTISADSNATTIAGKLIIQ